MADIKIEAKLFQERISDLTNTWKADVKRSGDDGTFGGVGSIVIMMGKVDESPEFHKNNAMHVSIAPSDRLLAAFANEPFSSGCLVTNFLRR